jgi:hypothetical protein
MLWAGVVAAPLVWLMLLQVNYILAYLTCASRSNTWLYISSAVGLALMAVIGFGAHAVWRSDAPAARHHLSLVGLFMVILFTLLVIGTALPPFILHPCD